MFELQELISFLILLLVEEEEKWLVYLRLRGPWTQNVYHYYHY